jgi:Ca-activated chloride channel homolog
LLSIGGQPLEMAKQACLSTLSILEPSDLFEVVAFDAKPVRAVRMQRAHQSARIEAELSRLDSGGGTEIFPALDMAYKDLLGASARKKHMILLTDGNADSEGLAELASAALADGITLTAVGFGTTINEQLLRALADLGGGRFHVAHDASLLPRIFTRETELMTHEDQTSELLRIQVNRHVPWLKAIAIDSAPPLTGAAKLRFDGAAAELVLTLEGGYPLLAEKRVGLGSTVAWASDLKSNYARHLLRWRHFPGFLAQLLRGHGKRDDTAVWPLAVEVAHDGLLVSVDAFTGEFNSGVVSTLWARSTLDETGPELEVPLRLVAPGRYEARVPVPPVGASFLRAEHRQPTGELLGRSFYHFSRPYPEEYVSQRGLPARALEPFLLVQPNRARQVMDPARHAFRRVYLPTWLLALAALLLISDVAVRRVRFGRESS